MAVSPWSKGFSRQSDLDGLVRCKIVDEYLANESEAIKRKVGQRFMSEPAYRAVKKWGDGSEASAIVKEKAYRNLSARNWVQVAQGWSMTAIGFKVVPGKPVIDWNSPPEAQKQASNVWTAADTFEETHQDVVSGKITIGWCTDWDPSKGTPEYWLKKVKEKVWALKNPGKQPEVDFT